MMLRILVIVTILFRIFTGTSFAQELLKDSDFDGIPDTSEIDVYQTNPLQFDTDGDGYNDLTEVQNQSNPRDADATPVNMLSHEYDNLLVRDDPLGWYVSRIFGISAFILLTGVMIMGLTQTSKILIRFRVMGIPVALKVHRLLSFLALTSLVVHIGSLFFDEYVGLTFLEAIVPFRLTRSITSALGFDLKIPVGLGIISLYLIMILIVTSEKRGKLVSTKIWRVSHYSSFLAYLTFLAHGFLSGSDSKQPWMIVIYSSSVVLVLFFVILRVFKKYVVFKRPVVLNQGVN